METEVKGIAFDSRKVEKGYLFVAISGTHADGHDFIDEVVEKGAVAIVYEKFLKTHSREVSYIKVANSAEAMGPRGTEGASR